MKCLKCNKRVMELGLLLEDGSYCIKPGTSRPIEFEGNDEFIRCLHCSAKNILGIIPSDKGPEKLYFHHFKMD